VTTKKRKKRGNVVNSTEGVMVRRLDAILEALQNLLIMEGHSAGMKKAKVRTMVKVADARVSKVWRQLEGARKANAKK